MVFDNNTVGAFFFLDLENNIKGQYYCKIPRTGYVVICFNESQQISVTQKGTLFRYG